MRVRRGILAMLMALSAAMGCAKKKDETNATQTTQDDPNKVRMTGTIALTTLRLNSDVSHVIAFNTQSGETQYAAVAEDGSFKLSLDRKEPWFLSYIDDSKSGADMIVATFSADTLDTLNAGDETTEIAMGKIDVSGTKAKMELNNADFLSAIGMSSEAAGTVGAVDDASLRYSNPDIDNNGAVDAVEGKSYMIDFHNRFLANKPDGSALGMADMKNAFYGNDTVFSYSGTGVMPQIPKSDLGGTAPATYQWVYSVDMAAAGNGGQVCTGMNAGDAIAAGTACTLNHGDNTGANGDDVFVFNTEVPNLKAGDYKLIVGDKTYFWKNLQVSDFSAGEGFLVLFLRMDVDANNKLTGLSYKWQIKGANGTYSLASTEAINLIVKNYGDDATYGGFVSLKYQGNEPSGSLGVMIPKKSEGSIVFADELQKDEGAVNVRGSVLTKQMVIDGVPFDDLLTNPGISYDDKIGMRFFF